MASFKFFFSLLFYVTTTCPLTTKIEETFLFIIIHAHTYLVFQPITVFMSCHLKKMQSIELKLKTGTLNELLLIDMYVKSKVDRN